MRDRLKNLLALSYLIALVGLTLLWLALLVTGTAWLFTRTWSWELFRGAFGVLSVALLLIGAYLTWITQANGPPA